MHSPTPGELVTSTSAKIQAAQPEIVGGSPERFGYEWAAYSAIMPQYEVQFQHWLPFFKSEDWRGKVFLDVGCGMGRNSYWPMTYGAAGGLAIDVDDRSLEAARANLAPFPTMEVRKLSGYEIDRENAFDIVFSIGVIHHLEWPSRALQRMFAATKPGGRMAIWVYGCENNGWLLWALDPARKLIFSRLPISVVHAISNLPATFLYIALRAGLNQIEYFRLLRTFSYRHLRSIVFDQMLPRTAFYWRKEEVEELMRTTGLVDIELTWVNEMSWAAVGTKAIS